MRFIDKVFDTEFEIGKIKVSCFDILVAIVLTAIGLMFRFSLYDIQSADYNTFLSAWMRECHEAGGWAYLGIEPGVSEASTINYNVLYQYLIVLLHYIGNGIDDLYLIKTLSVIFDFVCAITLGRIAYLVFEKNIHKGLLAYFAVLFLPTVVLNSSAWAQDDSIYTAFILLSLLHVLKGTDLRVFLYLVIAYSFKQQAVFFLPFIIIMWLKNKIKIRYALVMPVFYIMSLIPAVIAGRSWSELFGIYGGQASLYTRLSMNYPSIYTIITSDMEKSMRRIIIKAGILGTIMAFGMLAYYIYYKKFEITEKFIITLVIFTAEMATFCLPVMHERYGYMPEVLAIVYALYGYKRLPICAFLQVISMITYTRYLFGATVTNLWPLSVAMLGIILTVGYDLYRQMQVVEGTNA